MASSIRLPVKEWFEEATQTIYHRLSQPHIVAIAIGWLVTFTLVRSSIMRLGFGRRGVSAGTFAASFQSTKYGGTTPARGIFATMTSMAMSGTYAPMAVVSAASLATIVAFIVWIYGVGR
ncbi:hypothetical protein F4679DRAFT_589288 [Xylaria curta]|nr:hypothetical protein F4679DRAFT_589288 [Xylaria curta]